jgi:hypothetical protein
MTGSFTPERWAFEITHLLNAVFGIDRFPIDVAAIAREYSQQRFPKDPILKVLGDDLPGFDGALYPAPSKKGWAIIYNNRITSPGRINFTLAHEFGHYLLHRLKYPNGFECGQQKIVRWDSEYGQVENEANVFAANLLMPLDDFRRQLPSSSKANFEAIKECAERYRVSLMAATIRWLSYTQKRAILVVSREGFILWARSSEPALKTGAFFRTSNGPIELSQYSLPLNPQYMTDGKGEMDHPKGVWLGEPVREVAISAEQYDFSLSLLLLEDSSPRDFAEDSELDTYDRMLPIERRRGW